jgi:hypothetical protein
LSGNLFVVDRSHESVKVDVAVLMFLVVLVWLFFNIISIENDSTVLFVIENWILKVISQMTADLVLPASDKLDSQ